MKTKSIRSGAFIIGFCLLLGAKAFACVDPPCPPCRINWPACVWNCTGSQVCCNNSCCTNACCDDITCYNNNTTQCCGYGTGKTCPKNHICCSGNCCNPATECCVGHLCLPNCAEGGLPCTYNLPPGVVCRWVNIDDWTCNAVHSGPGYLDGYCGTEIVDGPSNDAVCMMGCTCQRNITWCVKTEDKVCTNVLTWMPPFIRCDCVHKSGLNETSVHGTKYICM